MNRSETLALINEVVESEPKLVESDRLADCADIDSFALLNLFMELKKRSIQCEIKNFVTCITVGDLVSLLADK